MKYSFCIIAACLFILFPQNSSAAQETPVPNAIQESLDLYIDDPLNAGAVFMARQAGNRHIYKAGLADIEKQTPISEDHRFHIASLSKMFTAVIIYQLIDEGKLSLDTKLSDLLGDPFDGKLENYNQTTVQMALEHSSGMPDFLGTEFENEAIKRKNHKWTTYEVLQYAAEIPATHKAGTAYMYNSSGYALLGEVIAKIENEADLNIVFQKRIFTPLSMNDTYFPEARPRSEKLARGYKRPSAMSRNIYDVSDIEWAERLADGGLVSTLGDLEKFMDALFEADSLLSQQHLDFMMDKAESLPIRSDGGRGLMVINRHDLTQSTPLLYGHFGRYLGYRSFAFYNPDNKDLIILLANSEHFPMHNLMQELGFLAPY